MPIAQLGSCRLVENNIKKYASGSSKQDYDIVTGDESKIYFNEPVDKQQSTIEGSKDESDPPNAARARSISKQMVAFVGWSFHKLNAGSFFTETIEFLSTQNNDLMIHPPLTWHRMTTFNARTKKNALRG